MRRRHPNHTQARLRLTPDGWHEQSTNGAHRVTVAQAVALCGNRATADVLDQTRCALSSSPKRAVLADEIREAEHLLAAAAGHQLAEIRARADRIAAMLPTAAPDLMDELTANVERVAEAIEAWRLAHEPDAPQQAAQR